MSQFVPQLSALTSIWGGPALAQVGKSVELLRTNVMTRNDVLIDRQAGEVRTHMVSCPDQLRTPLALTLPYQLFLAMLTSDESALAEPLAVVCQILSDGPSRETCLAAWDSKWVGCCAATLETTFTAKTRAHNTFAHNVFTRIADLAAQACTNSISPSELAWKAKYSADLLR